MMTREHLETERAIEKLILEKELKLKEEALIAIRKAQEDADKRCNETLQAQSEGFSKSLKNVILS